MLDFRDHLMNFEIWLLLKPVLGGVDSVAPFITDNEQSESNPDCSFHSSIVYFASRSYYQIY